MRPPGSPRRRGPGRLHREAAGERPPRARPQRRGSPGPIPNPAVKPAFAESTAARGCGRAGRRARGGRFSMLARLRARGDARRRAGGCGRRAPHAPGGARRGMLPPAGLFCVLQISRCCTGLARGMHRGFLRALFPSRALPGFWEGCGIASGVARDAGRLTRRRARARFAGWG